ncbi:MAG: class I SAM-dependent RNA methyltransferase [Treponema sp.]|nr:class I SAM-dependent RNA methyltransferase [Treponema sp.]
MQARVEKIVAGGAGLARIDGKTIFIEGTAPGETVLCRITKEHRSWAEAELLEIIESSPDRVQPDCAHYGICGGCNLQHIKYTAQIAAKTAILQDTFARIGGFNPPEPLVIPSKCTVTWLPWKYRNRMQFHIIRNHQTGVFWGLKARKSADIVPISDCPIADPGIQELFKGKIPVIPPEKDRFTVYARNGLLLYEGGTQRGKTKILDKELSLDAGVFFQSNGAMLEKMLVDLRTIAGKADRNLPMADLYCGVGTFSAFLGELFPHIDLVEAEKTALALARENLIALKSTAFYAQSSENWAKTGLGHPYGFIIVDPPRQGLDPALAQRLAKDGPPLLAYVSCDPATLARDSAILRKGGYELSELRWYDFYPQTAHIESLALFLRINTSY